MQRLHTSLNCKAVEGVFPHEEEHNGGYEFFLGSNRNGPSAFAAQLMGGGHLARQGGLSK